MPVPTPRQRTDDACRQPAAGLDTMLDTAGTVQIGPRIFGVSRRYWASLRASRPGKGSVTHWHHDWYCAGGKLCIWRDLRPHPLAGPHIKVRGLQRLLRRGQRRMRHAGGGRTQQCWPPPTVGPGPRCWRAATSSPRPAPRFTAAGGPATVDQALGCVVRRCHGAGGAARCTCGGAGCASPGAPCVNP